MQTANMIRAATGIVIGLLVIHPFLCVRRAMFAVIGFLGGSDLSVRHRVEPGNFNSPRAPVCVQLRKALPCSCMITVVQHCGSPAAAAVIVQARAKRSITLHFPRARSLLKALQQWNKIFKKMMPQKKACFCHEIKINKTFLKKVR